MFPPWLSRPRSDSLDGFCHVGGAILTLCDAEEEREYETTSDQIARVVGKARLRDEKYRMASAISPASASPASSPPASSVPASAFSPDSHSASSTFDQSSIGSDFDEAEVQDRLSRTDTNDLGACGDTSDGINIFALLNNKYSHLPGVDVRAWYHREEEKHLAKNTVLNSFSSFGTATSSSNSASTTSSTASILRWKLELILQTTFSRRDCRPPSPQEDLEIQTSPSVAICGSRSLMLSPHDSELSMETPVAEESQVMDNEARSAQDSNGSQKDSFVQDAGEAGNVSSTIDSEWEVLSLDSEGTG